MNRVARVSQLLRQAIATILLREIRSDKVTMVSILYVDLSPDFQNATVYYSLIGSDDDHKKTQRFLRKMAPVIKGKLGRTLALRTVPTLRFRYKAYKDVGTIDK